MKTKSILLIAIVVGLIASSSRCVNINDGITPSKNYITRDYKVGNFSKLDILTVANIDYTPSTDGTTSLQIYGPDNIVELVNVDVKDDMLTLSMKKKNIKKSNLKITISSPDLQYAKSSGVGDLTINGTLKTANLTIKNEGVGNIKINHVSCTELDIHTEGVGNVTVQGKAEKVSLVSQGVGNINASGLESRAVTALSEGVGNISCHATESIHASAHGVGNISYKGNPKEKDLKKSGIGSIKEE